MRQLHFFACSLVLGLTACGGGGDGGSVTGTGGSGGSRSPIPPQTALTYSGAVTGAAVSATSAGTIASNVIGSTGGGLGGSLLAGVAVQVASTSEPQPSGATGLGRRLGQAIRTNDLAVAGSGGAVTGAAINRTIACDSGSIVISGDVNDSTGRGTASVDYVDCRTGADTINGPGQLTIRGYDQARGIVTDGTLNFTRVRLSGPGMSWDVSGRVSS